MEEAEDGFLEHTAARESGQWAQMRAAKNRRLCTSIREALDGVQRQHQVELRNHRYDVAMRRHESELARTRSAKATRDALKQNAVKEVLAKRDALASEVEKRHLQAHLQSQAGLAERFAGLERAKEQRRAREASKAARRCEAIEQKLALQQVQQVKFEEQKVAKERRVRRQKKKNELEKVQRVQLVKRLSAERRAKTAEVKKTMHHEAEAKLEARRIREEKRSAQRAQQAAALAKQRKVLERELWIDADRNGLRQYGQCGARTGAGAAPGRARVLAAGRLCSVVVVAQDGDVSLCSS